MQVLEWRVELEYFEAIDHVELLLDLELGKPISLSIISRMLQLL